MIFHKILWTNGIILDVENNKEYDWLLTRNKAIFSMGTKDDKPEDYDEIYDLEGKVLMSAFIKPYGSFSKDVLSYLQPDLSHSKSFEGIKDTIEKFIKDNNVKANQWIIGRGFDVKTVTDKTFLDKDYLDLISKTNPIVITQESGRTGVFNSIALKQLKIDDETVMTSNELIKMNEESTSGYLDEQIYLNNLKKIPAHNQDDVIDAIYKAQVHNFSQGITMAQEGMMTKELIFLYQLMLEKSDLDLDIVYYTNDDDVKAVLGAFADTEAWYDKNLKYGGIHLALGANFEDTKTDIIETSLVSSKCRKNLQYQVES